MIAAPANALLGEIDFPRLPTDSGNEPQQDREEKRQPRADPAKEVYQLDMMVMMSLWLTVRIALYENYSSTEEFLPQFDANVEDIIKLLDDIPKLKEMVNNGRKP